jgi:hypothetical protein
MSSKFSNIFAARKNEDVASLEEAPPPSPAPDETHVKSASAKKPKLVPAEKKQAGRPRGKRSDGAHVQVTAYIERETHHQVKVALVSSRSGQEFSELIQELLSKWIKSRT